MSWPPRSGPTGAPGARGDRPGGAPAEAPFVLHVDGPAELARLDRFRAAHPDVLVGGVGFGTWQALIPEPNGETVVVRYTLRELLDKLDGLFPDLPGSRGALPPAPRVERPCQAGWRGQRGPSPRSPSRVPRPTGAVVDGPCRGLPDQEWPALFVRRALPRHGPPWLSLALRPSPIAFHHRVGYDTVHRRVQTCSGAARLLTEHFGHVVDPADQQRDQRVPGSHDFPMGTILGDPVAANLLRRARED